MAFGAHELKAAVGQLVGIMEDSVGGSGIGNGVRKADLIDEFEPREIDDGVADCAFEFALGFEDEGAIGGDDEASERFLDALGQAEVAGHGGQPAGDVRVEAWVEVEVRRRLRWACAPPRFAVGT